MPYARIRDLILDEEGSLRIDPASLEALKIIRKLRYGLSDSEPTRSFCGEPHEEFIVKLDDSRRQCVACMKTDRPKPYPAPARQAQTDRTSAPFWWVLPTDPPAFNDNEDTFDDVDAPED
jgi:hypothetical protein